MTLPTPPAWHQALVQAITGRTEPALGRQEQPDLDVVEALLLGRPDAERATWTRPHRVSSDLAAGIGAAQLWAAVAELRSRLGLDGRPVGPVTRDRALSADEQRLLRDVPPHHGS